jgi:hypothetical protein
MCDASDYVVGTVLGQRKESRVHAVYYASKALNGAQLNYATTEKELLAVVSKWVEAMPCRKASTEESITIIKNVIFPRFGTPRILISDGGTHFTWKNFKKCLSKLGIEHRVSTAYHP